MSATIHYAFEYLDMGLSVLPLDGKKPLFRWKHLTERLPTHEEIRQWFGGGDANIGIICGQVSRVVAFDADDRDIAAKLMDTLPHTAMMTATGRGTHFYYRIEEGQAVEPRVKVDGIMLDIRGEASYCVACPSIHRQTGRSYRRLGSWNLEAVPYFDPSWIDGVKGDYDEGRRIVKSIRNPAAYVSRIRAVSGEGGHNATFRAACALRDAGVTPDEALVMLIEWNDTNAKPPWTIRELQHKVRGAFEV